MKRRTDVKVKIVIQILISIDSILILKMFYSEYLQPGFTSCTPEELENNFSGEKPSEFRMGAISTAWHKVEVDAMTKFDHMSQTLSQETQGKINAVQKYNIRKRGLTCTGRLFLVCFRRSIPMLLFR